MFIICSHCTLYRKESICLFHSCFAHLWMLNLWPCCGCWFPFPLTEPICSAVTAGMHVLSLKKQIGFIKIIASCYGSHCHCGLMGKGNYCHASEEISETGEIEYPQMISCVIDRLTVIESKGLCAHVCVYVSGWTCHLLIRFGPYCNIFQFMGKSLWKIHSHLF